MSKLFSVIIAFFLISGLCLPMMAQTKAVQKIIKELNQLDVPKALQRAEKLIEDNPKEPAYKEMQVMMLWQILERIQYSRSELAEMGVDNNDIPGYLASRKIIESDSLDLSAEIEIATSKVTKDTAKTIVKVQVDKAKKNEEPIVEADDLIGGSSSTTATNNKKKRKKKKDPFAEEENAEVIVTIDSSLILETNPKNLGTTLGTTTDDNSVIDDKGDLINSEQSAEDALLSKLERQQARDERKRQKAEAAALAEEQKRLKMLGYFAGMDDRFYKQLLIDRCREYTLDNNTMDSASHYLYKLLVDTTLHPMEEQTAEFIDAGLTEYQLGNFEDALNHFNDAMNQSPEEIQAYLNMGKAYFKLEEDSMATLYFKTARKIQASLNTADEDLAKYYFDNGIYDKATDYTVLAISKYPEAKYFGNLKRIAERSAADFVSQWIPRPIYPHSSGVKLQKLIKDTLDPWYYYQMAANEFRAFSNTDGILKTNEKTPERYLEVASWLFMLDSAKDKNAFPFARAMRKIGYLDCYVLITEFHHDLYPQFLDLATRNPEKVLAYMSILCSWHKGRFDQLKATVKVPEPAKTEARKKKK